MDGHGGKEVASFCQQYLPAEIAKGSSDDAKSALVDAFHRMDEMLFDVERNGGELPQEGGAGGVGSVLLGSGPNSANPDWVGCTCVVCLIRPDTLVVANA